MTTWLETSTALALIGRESEDVDEAAFDGALAAARDYVERKRSDLMSTGVPPQFAPGADIKLGTAMLANRWYERRSAALGAAQFSEFGAAPMLRHDPDIAKLLGLGTEGGFVFGSPKARR